MTTLSLYDASGRVHHQLDLEGDAERVARAAPGIARFWHSSHWQIDDGEKVAAADCLPDETDNAQELHAAATTIEAPPGFCRRWRDRMEWTQDEAAEHLGLSRRTLAYYESGKQPIPRSIILACAALTFAFGR